MNDKLSQLSKISNDNIDFDCTKLPSVEKEESMLEKFREMENKIKEAKAYETAQIVNKFNEYAKQIDMLNLEIERRTKENEKLEREKDLEKQRNIELLEQYQKLSMQKQSYNDKIAELRNETIAKFESNLAEIDRKDAECKKLQKEFILMSNILKFRIIDDDEEKTKGFFINDKTGEVMPYVSYKNQSPAQRSLDFWTTLNSFLGYKVEEMIQTPTRNPNTQG